MPTDGIDDGPTAVQFRRLETSFELLESPESIERAFNHVVFCQASLPYRVRKDQQIWQRKVGGTTLHLQAGFAPLKKGGGLEPVPLPSGPRARLVLIHVMTQAVLNQSPVVELEDNLTAFVKSLGLSSNGRNIRSMRDQLQRLSSTTFRLMMVRANSTEMVQGHLVDRFEVFAPPAAGQRAMWPSYIQLSDTFYESLVKHAVPLDPRALGALKHSASALDTYQWLAQRLWRVNGTASISWGALHGQLGGNTQSIGAWKQEWLGRKKGISGTLPQVLQVYPAAREAIEITEEGLTLRNAAPPVPRFGRTQQRRVLRRLRQDDS